MVSTFVTRLASRETNLNLKCFKIAFQRGKFFKIFLGGHAPDPPRFGQPPLVANPGSAPDSSCPEMEIWPFLKGNHISETGETTPTITDVHARDINPYLHEFFEPIPID